MRKQSLILTATVTPHVDMRNLRVTSPNDRLGQYCDAFKALVASGATEALETIYLCENSGNDMKAFEHVLRAARCHVEFVRIPPDASNGFFGRGYSEMLLIDAGLRHPRAADEMQRGHLFWKLTGRYRIANLEKILRYDYSDLDLVINIRRLPKKWSDLYLYGFDQAAWTRLIANIDRFKETGEETITERTMYFVIETLMREQSLRIATRLPFEPHIVGIRGWDNREYDSGVQRLKRHVRQALRVVAPGLHV